YQVIENPDYVNTVSEIENYFQLALAYSKDETHTPVNLRFEAMQGVFNGEKKLFIHANGAKEIIHAIHFAESIQITPVIVGGNEANLVLTLLKEKNIPVILERVHALPSRNDYDIDMAYKLPFILQQAGILYGISVSNGSEGFWNQRNLPFEAGTAAAYGLTKEEALQCITLNNAKILGIDSTAGSLEKGKDATLLICEGDILDMRTNKISTAFIRGRKVATENWQNALYEKYSKKYNLK
ncbi:MAG: amidohydrolase family protein, partial [Chitinophagales bacterium]|nr:amidohydrolase family protein [Chitinophagales bacterium]